MRTIIILMMLTRLAFSQPLYEIPFASEGNEIELEVLNASEVDLINVAVTAIEKPDWLKFSSEQEIISELGSNKNGKTLFHFDVDKEAEVMEERLLKFQISGNNQVWNKEIKIRVLPPDKFELNQNYPNPFNPTTTISYTIPGSLTNTSQNPKVNLTVYDVLGRHVETLVNEEQKPGYYKYVWNASSFASEMYIYQISIKEENSKTKLLRKKMMLTK